MVKSLLDLIFYDSCYDNPAKHKTTEQMETPEQVCSKLIMKTPELKTFCIPQQFLLLNLNK